MCVHAELCNYIIWLRMIEITLILYYWDIIFCKLDTKFTSYISFCNIIWTNIQNDLIHKILGTFSLRAIVYKMKYIKNVLVKDCSYLKTEVLKKVKAYKSYSVRHALSGGSHRTVPLRTVRTNCNRSPGQTRLNTLYIKSTSFICISTSSLNAFL